MIYYLGHNLIESPFVGIIICRGNTDGTDRIIPHYKCIKCGFNNFIDIENNQIILTCNERIIKGIIE